MKWLVSALAAGCVLTFHLTADSVPGGTPSSRGPLSPREELATFTVDPGLAVTLVASEPDVVDPVAMCFDAKGRIYVCEMRGYPNGGVGTGNENRGRIRCLTDQDGDGTFETAQTFAEGLRFPMGVTPWKGGLLVAVAPDIVYLQDTDNDGRADKSTVLYTGFNLANIQQMVNGLQWGLDNRIHGLGGSNAGTITSPAAPAMPAVTLQSRGFSFDPDRPESFEPTSGGGQYGITADEAGHWFTATNSSHLRQIVIPDRYLRRNGTAMVTAVTADISDHGASCRLYRTSPFEGWRVERTTRRAGSPAAARFQATELVPGGFSSSTCSPIVYTAGLFPQLYHGNVLVCDPGNNVIHRDRLDPVSSTFLAQRTDAEREFLTSTDNWFRPVDLEVGPDGAVYMLDFYREVIETPLSLPDDIKAALNLESRARGRIWRIAPTGFTPGRLPDLSTLSTADLIRRLSDSNSWIRLTAHRLLVEKEDPETVKLLKSAVSALQHQPGLGSLLNLLNRLNDLDNSTLIAALEDQRPSNRIVGLRLVEARLNDRPELRSAVLKLVNDPYPPVRFQLALTAGSMPPAERSKLLTDLLAQAPGDTWLQSAVLLSIGDSAIDLVRSIRQSGNLDSLRPFVVRLVSGTARAAANNQLTSLFSLAAESDPAGWNQAILEGITTGLGRSRWLTSLRDQKTVSPATHEQLLEIFNAAAGKLKRSTKASERISATRLLAFAPADLAIPALAGVLNPSASPELQLAAVRALSIQEGPAATVALVKAWSEAGPTVRRELLEALLVTEVRTDAFFAAIERGTIRPAEVEPGRVVLLKAHPAKAIRDRAAKLFGRDGRTDRKAVIAKYADVTMRTGDSNRGQEVFTKQCASCHRIGDVGKDVGPNLLAVVPGKSSGDLLVAIFDPNREVDPRYVNYLINTIDGRVVTGIVSADTPGGITLRRADGTEETIRRDDIDSVRATGISLMPEGLEKTLPEADVADLLAFLRSATAVKPTGILPKP